MKNKLSDLNDHLFAQLERVNEEGISDDLLNAEIDRSKAVIGISKEIVANARLALDAERFKAEYAGTRIELPKMLEQQ